jgi:hypothetical protein
MAIEGLAELGARQVRLLSIVAAPTVRGQPAAGPCGTCCEVIVTKANPGGGQA